MIGSRRLIAAFLLLCVSLALGDAPYVDEYLDAFGVQADSAKASGTASDDDVAPSTASIKLCQNLLVLSCTSDGIPATAVRYASPFARAGTVAYSSIVPRRLDRPPTRPSQA